MYVFSHLHKAAGTTVVHVLRRSFGCRHLDVTPGRGHIYTGTDLEWDLGHFTRPVSIAGHGLRPHVDFGDADEHMDWYTVIRDPLERCLSHYQHQVQKMDRNTSFREWISMDIHRNWMVYFYGGSDSLQKAIDSICAKNMTVIRIDEGLREGLQRFFASPLPWIDRVVNPARNNALKDGILADESLTEDLREANALDLELYEFMSSLKTEDVRIEGTSFSRFPLISSIFSFLHRNVVYRPAKRLLGNRPAGKV